MNAALTLTLAVVLTTLTLRHVYRGGTTLNDHAVAFVVSGCLWIYPTLWWGVHQAGLSAAPLFFFGCLFVLGAVSIYGLFYVLDRRRPVAGALRWVGIFSQLAYAFSLWTGLLLVFWVPLAAWTGRPLFWPGLWLMIPVVLAVWGCAWTWLRHDTLRTHLLAESSDVQPVRVVQLSDLHASPLMTGSDFNALVRRVNALSPDLVVITGDFVMPFSEENHQYLIDAIDRIEAPTLGCLGNHDLPIRTQLCEEFDAIGKPLLVDERRILTLRGRSVEVVGLDFRWRGAKAATFAALSALPQVDADVRVLLVHDPRYFRWIPSERFDLVLSGHTHGGQVGTNMFGVPWSVLRGLGLYDQGFFERDSCRLYVHSGNWHTGLPPRMGIAAEIAVFTL
ncbi:MAG: metallophosphoesterase [Myxococcota bacterium]